MRRPARSCSLLILVGFLSLATLPTPTLAGLPLFRKRNRVVVETVAAAPRPQDRVVQAGMLGTFVPTPYVFVRDNRVVGEQFGRDSSLSVFGPLSTFRATSAPIDTVVRGYDGIPTRVNGTSFSNPNLPSLSPVVYPTRASNYSAMRYQTTSPSRDNGLMWIDQD